MSTHLREAAAAISAALRKLFWRPRSAAVTVLTGFLLSGCATAPASLRVGADPADPAVPVQGATYRSTTASYIRLRPSMPAPWRQQNERAAPQPKSQQ